MMLEPQQARADEALLQLGRRLRADGYRFTCVTPATHGRNNARAGAERAMTLRDVFGWSRPFAPSLLSADELQQLQQAQLLTEAEGLLRSKVRFASLDELLLVHSAYPTEASDAVFFGPDSYRFAQVIHDHLQRRHTRVQHAVDIGCGSGVGALLIARAAQHAQVSAVDINPLALRYTAINAALAGVSNLSVEPSDLLDGITGTFDLIVANPPYMLDAGQRTYRHGGGSLGAELSLRIVEQGVNASAPTARCCCTPGWPSSKAEMHCLRPCACAWPARNGRGAIGKSTPTCSASNWTKRVMSGSSVLPQSP